MHFLVCYFLFFSLINISLKFGLKVLQDKWAVVWVTAWRRQSDKSIKRTVAPFTNMV